MVGHAVTFDKFCVCSLSVYNVLSVFVYYCVCIFYALWALDLNRVVIWCADAIITITTRSSLVLNTATLWPAVYTSRWLHKFAAGVSTLHSVYSSHRQFSLEISYFSDRSNWWWEMTNVKELWTEWTADRRQIQDGGHVSTNQRMCTGCVHAHDSAGNSKQTK